jgi:acyl-CoA thioesterase-1
MKAGSMVLAAALAACEGRLPGKDTAVVEDSLATVARGAAADARPVGTPAAGRVVLIVGTSLTEGLGLDPEESYPAILQRRADSAGFAVRIVNAGRMGETSAGALRRIDWLLRDRADLVLIETGANDGLRGLDVDSTRENLRSIVRKVRRALPDAAILLAQMEAPPNLGRDYTSRFHDMFPAVAREERIRVLPFLLEGVAGVRRLNQADGIHPNREGARRVADNVWDTLKPLLDTRPRAERDR